MIDEFLHTPVPVRGLLALGKLEAYLDGNDSVTRVFTRVDPATGEGINIYQIEPQGVTLKSTVFKSPEYDDKLCRKLTAYGNTEGVLKVGRKILGAASVLPPLTMSA